MAYWCLVVALVAGFGTVVGCGLGMRSVLWWLLGLVHVFSLSFGDCFFFFFFFVYFIFLI